MRSHIKIKGRNLWKLCMLVVLGISLACCFVIVNNIDQPTTATAGQTITITLRDSVSTQINTGQNPYPQPSNFVLAFLAPKGWDVTNNNNMVVSYTSTIGNGNMQLMPASAIEPNLKLPWVQAATTKFGIGKNLVNDVEWVVFESAVQYNLTNGMNFTGNITIKLKVGADGNNTSYFPEYVTCDSFDGFSEDLVWGNAPIYSKNDGPCLVQTGTDGDLHDYCNPQLTSLNPPKSLDNEFVTLTYNNKLDATVLSNSTNLYLCVDSAYLSDGTALTNFCIQSEKSNLVQTSSNSGLFSLTFWPRSYFGLTASQTLTKLVYYITDQTGTKKVGYAGSPTTPFVYKFGCK